MNVQIAQTPVRRPETNRFVAAGMLRRDDWCAEDDGIGLAVERPQIYMAAAPAQQPEAAITRWRRDDTPAAFERRGHDDMALLAIALSATDATVRVDEVTVHDGRLSAGTFHLVAPGQAVSATFRKPADFIRLYIPRRMFLALLNESDPSCNAAHLTTQLLHDHVVEQLALTIVHATGGDHPTDRPFLDGIATALLARAGRILAARQSCPGWKGLLPWRLKKVVAFIEDNLDAPLVLADMAQAAGLSRMHFAAQFRLATGCRPHAYLTRRRIERAQELLRHTTMSLVEIALSVGFQTQAHFTTIFRQLAGEPPGQWRQRESATAHRSTVTVM